MPGDREAPVAPRQRVARWQLPDVLECRAGRQRRPEREDVVEPLWIDFPRDARIGEERLDLGGEEQPATADRIEERTHAEPVARQEQCAGAGAPDAERPLAIEPRDRVRAFLFVQMKEDLGVGVGAEAVTLARELGA